MDRRKNYYIILDTETCPIDATLEGVDSSNMLVYDIGFAVIDKKGNVYEDYSFIIPEIFIGESERMTSAYYYDKIDNYLQDINNGTRKFAHLPIVRDIIITLYNKYNCKAIIAHNARFDLFSLNTTYKWLGLGKYFFPYGTPIFDTLKMARDVVKPMKTYQDFCFENGFVTKHKTPQPQLKAETLYRFLTRDLDFVESHTGREDVEIEKEIFAYCMSKHKKMRKLLFE